MSDSESDLEDGPVIRNASALHVPSEPAQVQISPEHMIKLNYIQAHVTPDYVRHMVMHNSHVITIAPRDGNIDINHIDVFLDPIHPYYAKVVKYWKLELSNPTSHTRILVYTKEECVAAINWSLSPGASESVVPRRPHRSRSMQSTARLSMDVLNNLYNLHSRISRLELRRA